MRTKALCAALAVLCLGMVPVAAGASTHPFVEKVATGTPLPPPPPPLPPRTLPFDDACGVAVDAAGNRYVSDYHNRMVAVFNAGNEYVSKMLSPGTENSPCDLAVDSTGRLYGNNLHQSVVRLPGTTAIDSGRSTGVAVGADDRIYVAHRTEVSVYPPGGGPLALTIGSGGALGDAYGVAVSGSGPTQGYVYVGDAADDTVKVFDPAIPLTPIAVIDGAGTPTGAFTDLTDTDLAIDPTSGNLLVVDNLQPGTEHPVAAVDEFDPSGAYLGQISHWVNMEGIPSKPVNYSLIHAGPSGLTVDAAGNIYVTSGNEEGSVLYGFGPAQLATVPVTVAKAGSGAGRVTSQLAGISQSEFTGLDCGALCATEYGQGTALTLVATAQPHSTFTGWSGACSGVGSCKVTLNAATQVTAGFAAIAQRTLTVTRSGAGAGTVTSQPAGLDCGAICSSSFDQGAKVSLTAEALPGSEFTGWSGACSGAGECRVTLGANAVVDAGFKPIERLGPVDRGQTQRTLAITVGGSGFGTVTSDPAGIQCGTPCSGAYAPGTAVTLTATPDSESHFTGWSGCDSVAGNRCSVKLASSRAVSADFSEGSLAKLGALKLKGATGTLKVAVAGPGTLSASAKQLAPATIKAGKAGTVTLPLALSKAGKKALSGSPNGRLEVKIAITFKPSGGAVPLVLSRTVNFKSRSKK